MTEQTETLYNKDDELRDEVESILMHFCELAIAGDPEKELRRSTDLLLDRFKQYGDQRELDAVQKLYDYRTTIDSAFSEEFKNTALASRVENYLDELRFLTTKKEKE